ncbi:MAG: 16S rRNA (adenine(1518)-N(6)/adenine(1519)-N(6))-dimethyltransferase RsmA [Minisyncoccia bacterium]
MKHFKHMTHSPKKSLGQNFLKSQKALAEILHAGSVSKGDTILEIGPGKGALTEKLLSTGAHVVAIEKDQDLVPLLSEKFTNEIKKGLFNLIEGDILEFDVEKIKKETPPQPSPYQGREHSKGYKLIANIPYNITGAIIRMFLESTKQPSLMVLLVQKEVAVRIARDKKESILSLSVKAYGTPTYVSTVSKRYFNPAPKVDSAIIAILNINRNKFVSHTHETEFFKLIKTAFAHKRKQLAGNLKDGGYSEQWVQQVFLEHNIPKNIRAEDIHIETWLSMSKPQ